MLQTAFGNRVKELRNGKMLSQEDLTKRSGIERAQISKIEKGKINVTLETIEKLSEALSISVKELMAFDVSRNAHPFVKWAGGKTQILNNLKELMPEQYNDYYEPFIGGGALLFSLTPHTAFVNDTNDELVCAYKCLMDDTLTEKLLAELDKHEKNHNDEYYYQVREMDRDDNFRLLPEYIRAARMIYLNKACFNGLYRVNSKGYFNVPSGKKKTVKTYEISNINEIKKYFRNNNFVITNVDFETAVENAKVGDFVYFDPPYDVFPDKNGFVDYDKEGFGKEEQARLARVYRQLAEKGVLVMLSNHNTPYINELYAGFNIHVIEAKRMINSKGNGRGNVQEVIITNY